MKFNSASPFFSKKEIKKIIPQLKELLEGGGLLAKGPKVEEFEKLFSNYIGSKYGVAVNSGTSALEIVLKAIGIFSPVSGLTKNLCIFLPEISPSESRVYLSPAPGVPTSKPFVNSSVFFTPKHLFKSFSSV